MVRIEITAAAHTALAASTTRGLVEPQRSPEGGYFLWLAPKALKRLEAAQTLGEDYSAVNRNAMKHGDFTAEGPALKRQISALARMARETMGAIE